MVDFCGSDHIYRFVMSPFIKEITDLCVHILEDLSKRLGELAPQLEQVCEKTCYNKV